MVGSAPVGRREPVAVVSPVKRVAVVTGAARGIGAATVLALAAAGYRVVAVDVCADDPALPYPMGSKAELDAVVAKAGSIAGQVIGFPADVRDVGRLAEAVAVAESAFGRLDVAVAAAGVIAGGAPLWALPPEQERAVIDVDLGGTMNLARVAVPALLRAPAPRSGRFIAVASAAAGRGLPLLAAYCAAKAGVTGLVRALGAELRGGDEAQEPVLRVVLVDEAVGRLWLDRSSGRSYPLRANETSKRCRTVIWRARPEHCCDPRGSR